jgi:formylglycine-generating enzyme required for sulfatase activity
VVDVFISYKKERREHAQRLAAVLEAYGFETWWDYGLLVDAGSYDVQIETKLSAAKAVIVLWCSGARASDFVKDEARRAKNAGKLAPALIEAGVEPPVGFGMNEMAFLLDWTGDPDVPGVGRLVDAVERLVARPRKPARNVLSVLKIAPPLPEVTAMTVAPAVDTNAPPRPASGSARPAGPSFEDIKAIWADLKVRGTLPRITTFYEDYAKHTPLRFDVEHHIEDLEARQRAEEAARKAEAERAAIRADLERRIGPVVLRAAEAAVNGRPVAERAFPIELPGVSGWPSPQMIAIPPGKFLMGAPANEEGSGDAERPQHEVRIDQAFALGQHTVTFSEWDAAIAAGAKLEKPGDQGWGRERRPVIDVNWEEAQAYLAWLNDRAGLTGRPDAYRLPSEAEWEYACRAGTTTRYSFGDAITKAQAQFSEGGYGSAKQTVPVGSFPANGFGLHDMHGNVWEWCQDCWNGNYSGAPSDGSAWTTGNCSLRVLRGGSWSSDPGWLRSADRTGLTSTNRDSSFGFRLARTVFTP